MTRAKFLPIAGLCTVALTIAFAYQPSQAAGKGSGAVVKATALASKIDADGKQTVTITLAIDKGWHVYANPVKNSDFTAVQTNVAFNARVKPTVVKIQYPVGIVHEEKGGTGYSVYENKINIQAVIQRAAGDTGPLGIVVRFNACHTVRGICLAPGSEKITLP